jgi:hypothetical protein
VQRTQWNLQDALGEQAHATEVAELATRALTASTAEAAAAEEELRSCNQSVARCRMLVALAKAQACPKAPPQ